MPKQKKPTIDKSQIVVAVITATTAIIVAYWQFVWKPNHDVTTIPTLEPITYVGRVIDSTNQNPIKGAQIALDFEGVPPTVYTDNNGIYRFTLAVENEKVDGRVRVDATGYEKYDQFITIYRNIPNIDDIRLTPSKSPSTNLDGTLTFPGSICGGKPVKIVLPQNPSDFNRQFGYTVYTTDNSYIDPNQGLLSNTIRSLYVSQDGIWVGYGKDNVGEKGISFVSNPVDGARIWEMCLDRYGKAIGHIANSITADLTGNIWVATDGNGAWKLQNGVWDQFAKDDLIVSSAVLPEKSTFTVVSQGSNILVGTLKGLFRYNGINWTKVVSLEDVKIHAVAFSGNGDIWIGFIESGVRRIQPDGTYQDFNTSNSQLTNDNIRSLTIDEMERVWIATAGGGINIYDNGNWSSYRVGDEGVQSDNINALAQDRFGRIWAGTDKGTSYFDSTTGKWTLYTDFNTLAIGFGKSDHERCSYQDDPIWVGTNGLGLLNARLPPLIPIIENYNISNLPSTVKPSEKIEPIVEVNLVDNYEMSIGDFLQSTEAEEFTSMPKIGVDPDKLTDKGRGFQFSFAGNPITAPQTPGKYKLIWRLWQCGRYVDPPIELEFTVVP